MLVVALTAFAVLGYLAVGFWAAKLIDAPRDAALFIALAWPVLLVLWGLAWLCHVSYCHLRD